ncbi:MAG: N-glycosylase/DNA lyase [Candidatus Nanoarchaeia archaeon]
MESPLLLLYASKKVDIQKRLEELDKIKYESNERIFAELCFCLCTPQTKASAANKAINELQASGLLFSGDALEIAAVLEKYGVRFHNNKASFIVEARNKFSRAGQIKIKSMLNTDDIWGLRNWLADNVKGLGYKEASHFLRNIGYGKDIAILDRHILAELCKHKVISEIPLTLSKSKYLHIERLMKEFAKKLGISIAELDMLLWSEHGSLPLEEMK